MSEAAGDVILYTGPMCSGKTLRLLTEYSISRRSGEKKILLIGPCISRDQSSGRISARDGISVKAEFVANLDELLVRRLKSSGIKKLFIDEAQFFDNLAPFCDRVSQELGLCVFVSALDTKWNREEWPAVQELKPYCREIVMCRSRCNSCHKVACWSQRILEAQTPFSSASSSSTEDIQVHAIYEPRCDKCFQV